MKKILKSKLLVALLTLALFAGLYQPVSVKAEGKNFKSITPFEIEKLSLMNDGLMANADKSVAGTITSVMVGTDKDKRSITGEYYSFTLPKDGLVCLRYSMTESESGNGLDSFFTVYADKNLSVVAVEKVKVDDTKFVDKYAYLKAGTYYIETSGNHWNWIPDFDVTNRTGIAIGYTPTQGKDTDFKVSLSKTSKTTDDIIVTIKTEDPEAKIDMKGGSVADYLLDNHFEWGSDARLASNQFTVTENGYYTIRITSSLGKLSQQVINITNIDKTRPTTPTVQTAAANTKKIQGTADAGTVVYVKVGSKTYNVVARDNNQYTLSVSSALNKGTKITVYAKDFAGNKSDKNIVKVK